MVVQGEGSSWDDVDTLRLDDLVGVESLLLGDLEELISLDLVGPVGFEGLLDLPLGANSGETEDGGLTGETEADRGSMVSIVVHHTFAATTSLLTPL